MREEVSIIVKTFERPAALERLVRSILLSSASACRVLVGDASLEPVATRWPAPSRIEVFRLPFDSGLSYGRNYLVERVDTPYCVVLDDDLVFGERTRLEVLLALVKDHGFDLAAGEGNLLVRGKPGHANIEVSGKTLRLHAGAPPRSLHDGLPVYDMVNNFFLATTASLRDIRWDERLPVYGNHLDFFMRYAARYKSTFTPEVVVEHVEGGYSARGRRSKHGAFRLYQASRRFASKHGLDRYGETHLRGIRGFLDVFVPAAWAGLVGGLRPAPADAPAPR